MQSDIQERFEVLGFHILVVDVALPKRNGLDTSLVRAAKPYGPFLLCNLLILCRTRLPYVVVAKARNVLFISCF